MKYLREAFALAWGIAALGCSSKAPDFDNASDSQSETSASRADSGAADSVESEDSSSAAPDSEDATGERDSEASESGAGGSGSPEGAAAGEEELSGSAGGSSLEPDVPAPAMSPMGSSGDGPMSSDPDSSVVMADGFPLGEACSTAQQCESGFCADGVCCDTPCNGVCAECNAPGLEGTCTAAAADDECPELSCPDDTECRTHELLDDNNCAGLGECALEATCASVDVASGAPCQDGVGTCSGAGECTVPNKAALGEECTAAADCGSGFCANTTSGAKVCCDSACEQICQACGSDGFCGAVADDERCDSVTCDADTMCADYPDPLDDNRCAAAGQCVQSNTHCTPVFASAATSCGTGQFCDGAGSCDDACTPSETWCTSACRDLSNDDDNCGTCGSTCPTGTSCVSGVCECDGATEGLCQNACVDLATDVSNCGSCGTSCPQPSETGSSPACSNGMCGACGAYAQSCCSGASACTNGLSCSGGSCVCPTNTHRCTTGPAAGTCRSNTDASACGDSCEDCTQANAVAQCVSGYCNNTCRAGVSQLCVGSNGRPGCGSWDFEDGKQGWQVDANYTNSAASLVDEGDIGASGSASSLAIPYNNLNSSKNGVRVRVPLCGTVSLEGKTISGSLRLQTTSGTQGDIDFAAVTLFSGTTAAGSFAQVTSMPTNTWFTFETDLDSAFLLNPDATLSVTHVGMTLEITGWSGTIYLDDFTISD